MGLSQAWFQKSSLASEIFSVGYHSIFLAGLQGLGCHNGADSLILVVSYFHRTQGEFRPLAYQ